MNFIHSIGLIGCGNMGSAFLQALAERFPEMQRYVYDIDEHKCASADAQRCSSPSETVSRSDAVIIAVKPQTLPSLAGEISQAGGKRVISLAAGVSLNQLQNMFQTREVVRFMPTVAALALSSPVAVCWETESPPAWREDALEIAGAAGSAHWMPEELISGFIGVSGSGIAYIFQFLHALALGGTRTGLSYDQSYQLAKQTMQGALSLLEKTGSHPSQAVSSVISPGGTTIEGIHSLEAKGFTSAVMEAVVAAAEKSDTMTKQAKEKDS